MGNTGKVVHITTVHHPLDPRIYYKECVSLQKAGYDVTLIAPEAEGMGEEHPVPVAAFSKSRNRFVSMLLSPFKAYRMAKGMNADIYHFHDPELLPIAWLLKRKTNAVIYDIHEDYETGIVQRNYLNRPLRVLASRVYKGVEKLLSSSMKLCLAEKYYKEKYPEGRCILNYPLVNEKLLAGGKNSRPKNQLIYTGNVRIDRGALIHSAIPSYCPEVSVSFFGQCSSSLADRMKKQAEEQMDKVTIEGVGRYVPKNEIDENLANGKWLAGLAVFPPSPHFRKKELTKFFEYMTAGIPIICSDFQVWKDFVRKYDCGIAVNPDSPEEIRGAVTYLMENPDRAAEMGANGQKAVLNELNWSKEEEKLVSWYREIEGTLEWKR
ncbi:glycosyltransferase family 4 protein [Alteribacter natronophilus]|uniref:glycosyltransferase family 4 protein n=1 Tax=Alteribacter natronophilus TaxID=2583810 RepID=UPI00110E9A48|nr:glycosyltransferase family 4 protein [Alteribacter natronophilus]TMW72346.1 glycosyltransferase family 4 protein [Alteribacter natronophilus]